MDIPITTKGCYILTHMLRPTVLLLVLVLMVSLPMGGSFAQTSSAVTIDPSQVIAEIKPEAIGGMNINNSMVIIKIKDQVNALKIKTVTYPAGNVADDDTMIDTNSEDYFKIFKVQQSLLGNPLTFVQVRLFKGTPELAAAAVKRAKTMGIRVDYWSIGNEPDLYAPHKGDKSWTKDKYNQIFREYADAMRAVDPTVKVAGPLPCNPNDSWIESFIYECGDIVDVLAWHWYPTDGKASDESALATAPYVIDQIERYRSWLKDPEKNPKGYQRHIKLAITEYALHWNTPVFRHLTDMVAAVWTAEVAGYMAQYGLDYSHYFCLGQYGGHAVFEQAPSYMERPVFYVFQFYANHFGRHMVASSSNDSLIKVFASKDDKGKHYAILINQSPDEEKIVNVNLKEKPALTKTQGFILSDQYNGEKLPQERLKVGKDSLQVTLPPYSVVALEM